MQALNRTKGNIDKKGWIKGIILVIAWVLIFSLVKDLWQIRKGYQRIDEAKKQLAQEEVKNQMLKDKLNLVGTDEYKEKIIREQLNMQKVGEVVAVLPKNTTVGNLGTSVTNEPTENWEKWWSLIK